MNKRYQDGINIIYSYGGNAGAPFRGGGMKGVLSGQAEVPQREGGMGIWRIGHFPDHSVQRISEGRCDGLRPFP